MKSKQTLSRRQHELMTFIGTYIREHGYPPLQREMAEHMDCAIGTVGGWLFILEDRGWLTRQRGWVRAWNVPQKDEAA